MKPKRQTPDSRPLATAGKKHRVLCLRATLAGEMPIACQHPVERSFRLIALQDQAQDAFYAFKIAARGEHLDEYRRLALEAIVETRAEARPGGADERAA
jgi:hypothetical protein